MATEHSVSQSTHERGSQHEEALRAVQAGIRCCARCVEGGFIPEANPVFLGRHDHRWMILGQAPGAKGHLADRPWSGASGKTLRSWLARAGFADEDLYERFYLTSLTKCFPGPSLSGKGDRAASRAEIALCRGHLEGEFALIRPELVVTLGRMAAVALVGNAPLDALVGTVRESATFGVLGVPTRVIPLPHPSGVSRWLNATANQERLTEGLRLLRLERQGAG